MEEKKIWPFQEMPNYFLLNLKPILNLLKKKFLQTRKGKKPLGF